MEIPGGGLKLNNHPWGGYGYFLETHNEQKKKKKQSEIITIAQ